MKLGARQRTDLWFSKIEWRDYESYVFGTLQRLNPGSIVRHNVALRGTLTGRSRQIHIPIERNFGGVAYKIAVDCKRYKRGVDVKHVEAFLGMLEDLGMTKGVMITTKGYSKSALLRAKLGSRKVELHILSPDRLSEFQHIGDAFLWAEPLAAVLNTPEGWVADNEDSRPERAQFAMYSLGHTRVSAQRLGAYLYGNIILKTDIQPNMESIATGHEKATADKFPAPRCLGASLLQRSAAMDRQTRQGEIFSGWATLTQATTDPNIRFTLTTQRESWFSFFCPRRRRQQVPSDTEGTRRDCSVSALRL